MQKQAEIWKDITGFESIYQISNYGRLKSFKKNKSGNILSLTNRKGDYFRITLSNNLNVKRTNIHKLVAEQFLNIQSTRFKHIHHKDGNKQNNNISNLEIISAINHSRFHVATNPNITKGIINYNKNIKTFPILQYDLSDKFINEFKNGKEASIATGVCQRNILQVANKEEYKPGKIRKQAGGYIWKLKSI